MEGKVRTVISIVIPVFLFILFTASYQRYLPEKSVVELLDHYKSLQYNSEDISIRLSTTSDLETIFLNKVLPTMHYKVLDSQVTDDSAVVKVQISNINLDLMLQDYEAGLFSHNTESNTQEQTQEVDATINNFELDVLVQLLDNPEIKKQYLTQELELKLKKIDDNWVLEDDEIFFKAMLGYESEAISLDYLQYELNY